MLFWQAHIEMVPLSEVRPVEVKFGIFCFISVLVFESSYQQQKLQVSES